MIQCDMMGPSGPRCFQGASRRSGSLTHSSCGPLPWGKLSPRSQKRLGRTPERPPRPRLPRCRPRHSKPKTPESNSTKTPPNLCSMKIYTHHNCGNQHEHTLPPTMKIHSKAIRLPACASAKVVTSTPLRSASVCLIPTQTNYYYYYYHYYHYYHYHYHYYYY